jgi:diguanylate cyclase (GGDEF)-like protein
MGWSRPLRPGRLLRSWWKEERVLAPSRRLIARGLGLGLLALSPLLLLHIHHRSTLMREQDRLLRNDTLALVETALEVSSRDARDWARWDDTYHFARGDNPRYLQDQVNTAALFDNGAVLVMLGPDGTPLLAQGASRGGRSLADLVSCTGEHRTRLRDPQATLRLACRTHTGALLLGTATAITNNTAEAPPAGTLAIFLPLLRQGDSGSLMRQLEHLEGRLHLVPNGNGPGPADVDLIQPPIHGQANQLLAVRHTPLTPALLRSFLNDVPLLLAILGLTAGLRAAALLQRRGQRLGQRRVEQRTGQQIRRTCRQLDALLDGLPPVDRDGSTLPDILGRISQGEPPAAGGLPWRADRHPAQLELVSRRFQRFLSQASQLALFDALTQLPNRSYFLDRLAATARRHRAAGGRFAVLFIDIDRFKVINDTYGHGIGDAVLAEVCRRLRAVVGTEAFMARYGGDELVLILEGESPEDQQPERLSALARERARRMAACLGQPLRVGDLPIPVSLSIGITLVDPGECDIASVMQRCDLAMYQAKRSQAGRIIGPEEVIQVPQLRNYQLFTDLIEAIHQGRLQVFFQAITNRHGERLAVEALARWQHPQRGWIDPGLFLQVAEQHRQMPLLGWELIRLSLAGYRQLQARQPGLGLYLNLAPTQLLEPNLADQLLSNLAAEGLSPALITLELTEHTMLEPHPLVNANLTRLRSAGMRLALDDFGSGYSSLVLLRNLRPEVVKIDKTFIQALDSDTDDLPIVGLIANLAPQLGLELVAEGIEELSCLEPLAALGIQAYQGYALGRPLPLAEWLSLLGEAQEPAPSRAIT